MGGPNGQERVELFRSRHSQVRLLSAKPLETPENAATVRLLRNP